MNDMVSWSGKSILLTNVILLPSSLENRWIDRFTWSQASRCSYHRWPIWIQVGCINNEWSPHVILPVHFPIIVHDETDVCVLSVSISLSLPLLHYSLNQWHICVCTADCAISTTNRWNHKNNNRRKASEAKYAEIATQAKEFEKSECVCLTLNP